MKKIYNIRSKVVHGATIERNNIIDMSKGADEIARKLIKYIFSNKELYELLSSEQNDNIDEYFLKKIME